MEQNARTKRKMQGQKGKCKDDTKSDSLDRCEQVEQSKIPNTAHNLIAALNLEQLLSARLRY